MAFHSGSVTAEGAASAVSVVGTGVWLAARAVAMIIGVCGVEDASLEGFIMIIVML